MITIEYNPERGACYSDGIIEESIITLYKTYLNSKNTGFHPTITVAQELFIDIVRALIAEGKINHKDIRFVFNRQEIYCNEYGAIMNYPDGFCAIGCEVARRTLYAAMKSRKSKLNKL